MSMLDCRPRPSAGDPENPIKLDNRSELDEARHLAFILSRAMKAKAE